MDGIQITQPLWGTPGLPFSRDVTVNKTKLLNTLVIHHHSGMECGTLIHHCSSCTVMHGGQMLYRESIRVRMCIYSGTLNKNGHIATSNIYTLSTICREFFCILEME